VIPNFVQSLILIFLVMMVMIIMAVVVKIARVITCRFHHDDHLHGGVHVRYNFRTVEEVEEVQEMQDDQERDFQATHLMNSEEDSANPGKEGDGKQEQVPLPAPVAPVEQLALLCPQQSPSPDPQLLSLRQYASPSSPQNQNKKEKETIKEDKKGKKNEGDKKENKKAKKKEDKKEEKKGKVKENENENKVMKKNKNEEGETKVIKIKNKKYGLLILRSTSSRSPSLQVSFQSILD